MNVAVFRYCARAKFDTDSNVGGGRISRRLIQDLVEMGHEVTVLDEMSSASAYTLYQMGADCQPYILDLKDFDAAVVLTGPFNVMYGKSVFRTYERLASLRGKAIYCQWDVALPFHFYPEGVNLFASQCGVTSKDLSADKDWHLLSQLDAAVQVSKGEGKTVGYGRFALDHRKCFFELAELEGEPMKPCSDSIQAVGYFGSDRPGRMRELKRWFAANGSPPVHIHGQWSEKSRKELSAPNISFMEVTPETDVRAELNKYLMTFYMADPAYIATDFIAQRFIENAMAGVPTYYSDKLQPTVAGLVAGYRASDLITVFKCVLDADYRRREAEEHQATVLAWARQQENTMLKVLGEVLR